MKKISTLLALGLLTAAGASAAAPVTLSERLGEGMQWHLAPQATQHLANFESNVELGDHAAPGTMQKIFVDRQGNIFDARFENVGPLNELVSFMGDNGEEVWMTQEELPFYWVNYTLYQFDNNGNRISAIRAVLEWPTEYMFRQQFEFEGDRTEDGDVPSDKKDFSPVPFEVLANGYTFDNGISVTRTFTENMSIWPSVSEDKTRYTSWNMLPNEQLGIQSSYNGTPCYTSLDGQASNMTFEYFDEAESAAKFEENFFLKVNNVNRAIRNTYDGGILATGFFTQMLEWEAGAIHIFNTGELGSEILGDIDYYPEEWGPFQRYLMYIPGKYMEVRPATPNTPITDDNIQFAWKEDTANEDASYVNTNYCFSALFSPVGAEPTQGQWHQVLGEVVGEGLAAYYSIAPTAYSFVTGGYNFEWSELDGAIMFYQNFPLVPSSTSAFFFVGSKEGAGAYFTDGSMATYLAKSTQDIVYHYDPANISNTKTIPAVGDMEVVFDGGAGVGTIAADSNFNVSARNGAISVMAGENGRVSVYGINGQLLKSVDAKAGQTVNIEAAKGLYIVKAGKKAVKVIL